MLISLVDNALRHVPAGGHVAVTLREQDGMLNLRLADDGPGIPAADRELVFERFWRGAAAAQTPGTGLGLRASLVPTPAPACGTSGRLNRPSG